MVPGPARQPELEAQVLGTNSLGMRIVEPPSAPHPSLPPCPALPSASRPIHPTCQLPRGQLKPAVGAGGPLHPTLPPHSLSPGLWERFLEPLLPASQAQSSIGWLPRSSGELLAWCSSAKEESPLRDKPGWACQILTSGSSFGLVIQLRFKAPEQREKREEPLSLFFSPSHLSQAAVRGWKEHQAWSKKNGPS